MIYAIECSERNGNSFVISSLHSDFVVCYKDGEIEENIPLTDLFAHISNGSIYSITLFNVNYADEEEDTIKRRHVTIKAQNIVEAAAVPMDAEA